jgi:hypothetical protein
MTLYDEVITLLDDIPNEDENIEKLEQAMTFFCGNYNICEGFKYALRLTIQEHYRNQEPDDMEKLKALLIK